MVAVLVGSLAAAAPFQTAYGSPRVCNSNCNVQTAVVASNTIAVPVAVPSLVPQYVAAQYGAPVAQASYVQYGAGTSSSTSDTSTLEDRIAAKILNALQKSGAVPASAASSLVAKNCAQCHSGASAKGGLDLSDLARLDCETKLGAIARLLTDDPAQRMPPAGSGVTLSADDLGKVLQELSLPSFAAPPANQTSNPNVKAAPTTNPAPAPAPEVSK
jgi:mono/diheme cytochrome c family protein